MSAPYAFANMKPDALVWGHSALAVRLEGMLWPTRMCTWGSDGRFSRCDMKECDREEEEDEAESEELSAGEGSWRMGLVGGGG